MYFTFIHWYSLYSILIWFNSDWKFLAHVLEDSEIFYSMVSTKPCFLLHHFSKFWICLLCLPAFWILRLSIHLWGIHMCTNAHKLSMKNLLHVMKQTNFCWGSEFPPVPFETKQVLLLYLPPHWMVKHWSDKYLFLNTFVNDTLYRVKEIMLHSGVEWRDMHSGYNQLGTQ